MSGHTQTPIEPITASSSSCPWSKTKKLYETMEGLPLAYSPFPIQTHDLSVSSLAPASRLSEISSASERPKLAPPESPVSTAMCEYLFLKLMQESKTIGNDILKAVADRYEVYKNQIRTISDEHIQKLKERIEQTLASQWWDTLTKTALALYGAFTLFMGFATIHTAAGMALLGSGLFSIISFVLSESGILNEMTKHLAQDDEERRQKIGLIIQTAMGMIIAVLGIYGSLYTPQLGSAIAQEARNIIGTGLALFQGVAQCGKGISHAKRSYREGEQIKVQAALEDKQFSQQYITTWIENTMAFNKIISERTSKILQGLIQAQQEVARPIQG